MNNTVAYEMITNRLSHYSANKLEKYDAVMIDADGKYALADGTRPFVGVVEYGVDNADEMATVVQGIFPIKAGADIAKGGIEVSVDNGTVVTAGVGDTVIGITLAAATTGNLASVQMVDQYKKA